MRGIYASLPLLSSDATVPIGEAVQEALKYIEKIICNDITQVLDDLYKR